MLHFDGNNDSNHHGLRKAKQNLKDILEQYKTAGTIKAYDIIATGNLAVKHPLFEYARAFDYIVITDKGVFNINVKNWKQKRFITLILILKQRFQLIMNPQYIKLLDAILHNNITVNLTRHAQVHTLL